MKLFIITGTSGGLGLQLAQQALSQGDCVIGISRRSSIKHPQYFHVKHDLSKPQGMETKLEKIIERLDKRFKAVHLMNNAAGIEPVAPIGKFKEGIDQHVTLNLTAPILLTNYVISRFKKKAFITNIVSGAAIRPISGWSLYCSTKSGLRMFSDCLALEGVRTISFSPGIMDTPMQATIRKQKASNFSRVQEFRQYKDKNQLLPVDKVAEKLMTLINNPDLITKVHYNVNELQ